MKIASRRMLPGAILLAAVLAGGQPATAGQAAPAEKPLMAEQVFKSVQLLKGIPVEEFMATMGFFAASLNANCTYCHGEASGGTWAQYADETDNKQTARKMIVMMNAINKSYFAGRRVVTCYSCHRFGDRPKVMPSLAEQYSVPIEEEQDEIPLQDDGAALADQILDKYIQARGGAQRLATLTSFVAKGTFQSEFADIEKYPAEIYAKAPGQRTTIVHTPSRDTTKTYDGRSGWNAAPDADAPAPLLTLSGGELDGARVEAELSFPGRIKQVLTDWRVGFPFTIDDREVQVLQGTSAGGSPVRLYFDMESGLLVRLVRQIDTMVGVVPTQIDYSDYREVSGIKMPFHWVVTRTDGRSTFDMTEVQTNAVIDAAKFAKPNLTGPPR